MKKMMMVMAVVMMVMMCGCGSKEEAEHIGYEDGEIYSRLTKVVELHYDEDYVVVEDVVGYLWSFYGCEDWMEDDICLLTMKHCGSETIFDDEIIATTYTAPFEK